MSTDVIIPWSGNCVYRASSRSCIEQWWQSHGFNVVIGEIDGPWSKARAVAEALKSSTADTLVVTDGDVWSDANPEATLSAETDGRWHVPFSTVHRLTAPASDEMMQSGNPGGKLVKPPYRAVPGGGIVILPREMYDEAPLDPRFVGWGHEDEAWGMALRSLFGAPRMWNSPLWHLWHPPQDKHRTPERIESQRLRTAYARARRSPNMMRDVLSEARAAFNC